MRCVKWLVERGKTGRASLELGSCEVQENRTETNVNNTKNPANVSRVFVLFMVCAVSKVMRAAQSLSQN